MVLGAGIIKTMLVRCREYFVTINEIHRPIVMGFQWVDLYVMQGETC
jgi:hypothetical protein